MYSFSNEFVGVDTPPLSAWEKRGRNTPPIVARVGFEPTPQLRISTSLPIVIPCQRRTERGRTSHFAILRVPAFQHYALIPSLRPHLLSRVVGCLRPTEFLTRGRSYAVNLRPWLLPMRRVGYTPRGGFDFTPQTTTASLSIDKALTGLGAVP